MLAYCVMPNHWHLVLWPEHDGQLARFMLRLTVSHARRWLIRRGQIGTGHLYQGRYKSFAMQDDAHLSTVCRYVERNPVRAGKVFGSRQWAWGSAGQHAPVGYPNRAAEGDEPGRTNINRSLAPTRTDR